MRFNYAGTVDAYVLNSRSRGKTGAAEEASENTQNTGTWFGHTYTHSLFIARNTYLKGTSWDALNGQGLIFGKTYESNGVGYAMRAPTGGNGARGNNEWDRILDKNETYIKGSFGRGNWCQEQDRLLNTLRGADGNGVRAFREGMGSHIFYNYRPVLEVMNAKALGQDSLKAVTLQLNGGTVDGKTQI